MVCIFITGIGGFVGSHLARSLVASGHEVGGLLLPDESTKSLTPVLQELRLFRGNILQNEQLKTVFANFQPEMLFHLAALAPVSPSLVDPQSYHRVNYEGTVRVAESAQELESLQLFVFPSSSEVYGVQSVQSSFREDKPLQPTNPYSTSKLAAENYLQKLEHSDGFHAAILRFCNTYGRKFDSYVVEYFIMQVLAGKPLMVKTPNAFRDFLYIDDHVAAYNALLETRKPGIYNIGTGKPISIQQLAEKIVYLLDSSSEIVTNRIPGNVGRPSDYLSLDSTKARNVLGWIAKIPLDEGIRLTAEKILQDNKISEQ